MRQLYEVQVTMITMWTGIQIAIDVLLGGAIIAMLLRTRSKTAPNKGGASPMPEEIAELLDTLYHLIRELEAWDRRLSEGIEDKEDRIKTLMKELDAKRTMLEPMLGRAEKAIPSGKPNSGGEQSPGKAGPGEKRGHDRGDRTGTRDSGEDRYGQVLRLAGEGLSVDEIASQVRMSREEISLILDLMRKKRKKPG